ncbi:MAG TPA: aminodeoxychorismate/anthranilate synthase component II [Blastocatellia bacterium]|jgi:para-aminobenzoate synthetase component 2|nr:aminodeoxychorismate/anthranilate synthase component II [Blastocatellia bacterium]HKQ91541.1 aminodeoxychorismate/anthranilate synthase component II [Blastocatellia bacterium]
MILVIDNYDSFTYNLVQYLGELGADLPVAREIEVARNDRITIEEIEGLAPERIVLSPGPCTPDEAGITLDVIRHFAGKVPLLGVCLGHQAMGQAFGGSVVRAPYLMHGKTSQILHDGRTVFEGVENPFTATRYHSLIVDRASVPSALEVSATTSDGLVMGLRHREFICEGVQFHPESIMTASGKRLLANYLKL